MKTIAEIRAMSPLDRRIATVEALGYYRDQETGAWENKDPKAPRLNFSIPDYLRDLNAMHEVEKVLSDDQYDQYEHALLRAVEGDNEEAIVRYYCATAEQRNAAFLAVMLSAKEGR